MSDPEPIPDAPRITDIRLIPAPAGQGNLVGFVRLTIDGHWIVDSLVLVRTEDGLTLAFPKRIGPGNRRHAVIRPASRRARHAIELAILNALWPEVGA